jgi:hypothetical protein
VTTPTQLTLYNGALFRAGQRRITSLAVNEESRRVLDDIWNDGVVQHCLEAGLWNHALRTVKIDYDPDFTATFGYRYRFDKPSDHVRVAELCSDAYFQCPLLRMQDETAYWLADITPIYVRYTSNGASYGLNYALWPQTFADYVMWRMAWLAIPRLKDSGTDAAEAERKMKSALTVALSRDAMKEPPKFLPQGEWVSARLGGSHRKPRSTLLGR